ncbi:MAG: hypothetical protein EP332_09320 [Bacteroidetes bacterium]|nr:MAG: hypothetical protein EP332_09320 [Bacteroidota bacterium]
MSQIDTLANQVRELNQDNQVIGYWENRQARILSTLQACNSDFDLAVYVLYRLAHSLNNKEKYSAVFYLYKSGYLPIASQLSDSKGLEELKYELGKGLHHNRKYAEATRMFSELGATNFDLRRIEDWKDQSLHSSMREKVWVRADLLPGMLKVILALCFGYLLYKTKAYITLLLIGYIGSIVLNTALRIYRAYSLWKEFKQEPVLPSNLNVNLSALIVSFLLVSMLSYISELSTVELLYCAVAHFGLMLLMSWIYRLGVRKIVLNGS